MNLPCVDVVQLKASLFQNGWNAVRWPQQQLIDRVLRHVGEVTNVCLWLEAQLLRLCLGHNQASRRTVRLKQRNKIYFECALNVYSLGSENTRTKYDEFAAVIVP